MFDRWNSTPELINLALEHCPHLHAVPGQHDLPYHRYDDIKRSAYWTLVEAGNIINLPPGKPFSVNSGGRLIMVHGFPWGTEIKSIVPSAVRNDPLCLAVVHRYVWRDGHAHPGALPEDHVEEVMTKLRGFDVALFGDNHSAFIHPGGYADNTPQVFNHGTFIRRRSDERDHEPAVGLLRSDGSVTTVPLDTTADVWSDLPDEPAARDAGMDVERFVEFLRNVQEVHVSFKDAVQEYMRQERVPQPVQDFLIELIEKRQEAK